jgi:glycosyltransferase involved in cell wall biosynthesis
MIDWFDPAFKAGGPIRSCVNFVSQLHNELDIYVFTGAYDLGESASMAGIVTGRWTDYEGKAKVWYSTRRQQNIGSIRKMIDELAPDFIYVNGIFSPYFSLLPICLKRLGLYKGSVVLATRGMLKASALSFKPLKKKIFIRFFAFLGLHRKVRFQATDMQEKIDIERIFNKATIAFLPNFPGDVRQEPLPLPKHRGELSIFYAARVHPIKNLDVLLRSLAGTKGAVRLTIAGALDDATYWKDCEKWVKALDPSKKVQYIGEKAHLQIMELLQQHHLFALPSKGENFGHAIFEALSVGRPVLISDQTPWRSLRAEEAGWDIPLAEENLFSEALQEALDWDQEQYDAFSAGALRFATKYISRSTLRNEYIHLFS